MYSEKPWLKFYQDGVPEKTTLNKMTILNVLERSAKDFPENNALNFQGYRLTYKELSEMVDTFASYLKNAGVKKGDSVAVLLPNVIPCVVSYYAILKAGGVVVMNNPLYSDRELKHQFNDSGSKILITLDLLADRMVRLRPETGIGKIIYTSIGDYLPFPKSLLFPLVGKKKGLAAKVSSATELYRWKDIIKNTQPVNDLPDVGFDDPALYQYTGGTTGVSKGVILSHGNIANHVMQLDSWFPTFERGVEIGLAALPIFHVFGMSVAMNWQIINAWEIVLVPKPEPDALIDVIKKFKPTVASLVPTMIIGILNHPESANIDLSSIKGCFSGSAPLPVEVIKDFEKKTGAVIVEGFGLSEASPVTHINPFSPSDRKIGSIGIPLPSTECRIADLESPIDDAAVGEPGELLVKGPQVMQGYLGMEEETAQTLKDGWLHTGDVAIMDDDGYFFIVDRIKDMILSGGFNVYPREIDEVVYEHPKVAEACAVGIPHSTRGEQIKLFIVLKEGEAATEKEIITFCSEKLAKYKLPTEVEFRHELPKTNIGKILRKDLREEEVQEQA